MLYVAYNLAATLTSVPAGRHADRHGPPPGCSLPAPPSSSPPTSASPPTRPGSPPSLPPFVLAGIGIGCVETAEHAAVATHAPDHLRGSAFGLLAAVQTFGNLAASAIAGILWTTISPTAAFAYLAATMTAATCTLAIVANHTATDTEAP